MVGRWFYFLLGQKAYFQSELLVSGRVSTLKIHSYSNSSLTPQPSSKGGFPTVYWSVATHAHFRSRPKYHGKSPMCQKVGHGFAYINLCHRNISFYSGCKWWHVSFPVSRFPRKTLALRSPNATDLVQIFKLRSNLVVSSRFKNRLVNWDHHESSAHSMTENEKYHPLI